MKLVEFFARQSALSFAVTSLAVMLAIGAIDYATGPHLALLVFYLVPICLAAWIRGRRWGIPFACACGVIWSLAQLLDPHSQYRGFILLWNTGMRMGMFLISAILTSEVAKRKRAEAALLHQTGILQSILNSMGDGVIVANAAGGIVLSNPAAERMLRRGLGEVRPEQWLCEQETYLPKVLTGSRTGDHPLLRAVRGEVIDGAEMFLCQKNSNEGLWLSATGRPLLGEDGKPRGGVLVLSDISFSKLLERQIAEISDREQRRIGQDLHDNLCQYLVSTAFAVEVLREKLARDRNGEVERAEAIAEMINEAISQARQLARGLYPVRLEVDGLASALEELVAAVEKRTGVSCRFDCDEPVIIYDEAAGSNLFRIAQEAINNAVKHASAKCISVALGSVEDEVTLTIKDDGVGFPETLPKSSSMGLHIMHYRARMIGASLDIRRGVEGGTIVLCSFPNRPVVKESSHHSANERNTN